MVVLQCIGLLAEGAVNQFGDRFVIGDALGKRLRMLLAKGRSGCRRWDLQMGANTVAKAGRRVLCQFFIAEKNSALGDSRMSKQFAIPLANSIAIRPQLCRIDSHQS